MPAPKIRNNVRKVTIGNQSKPQSNQPKKQKKTRKRGPRDQKSYTMSACSVAFASALADPFGTPTGVCLPSLFPMPSVKRKDIIRSTMVCGTSGIGYISLRPDGANDSVAVSCTTATSALMSSGLLSAATQINQLPFETLPYTNTQVNSTEVQWRAVGLGLRARYIGKETDRNGVVTCYEMPNHASVSNLTPAQISSELTAKREHPSGLGNWHSVYSSGPKHPNDLDFNAIAGFENPYLVIAVSGMAGDRYEFECVQHIEYIGTLVSSLTPSYSDPSGYSRTINITQEQASTEPLSGWNAKRVFNAIVGTAADLIALQSHISPLFRRGQGMYDVNRITM